MSLTFVALVINSVLEGIGSREYDMGEWNVECGFAVARRVHNGVFGTFEYLLTSHLELLSGIHRFHRETSS